MDNETTIFSSTGWNRIAMLVVAAIAGAGLGIGGISLLGVPGDPVALQSASLPSQEAQPVPVEDAATPTGNDVDAVSEVDAGSTATTTGPEPPTSEPSDGAGGVVDQAAAERAAIDYLGEGRVTWVSQEDDYGAVWEIEVTLPNGREVDVYVDAAGQVVHTS